MYMHQQERNRALLLVAAQANYTFNLQLACVMTALAEEEEERKREERKLAAMRRKRRRFWVRSWLLRRPQVGYYERLLNELLVEDTQTL